MAKNQICAAAASEEAQDPGLPQSRISRSRLALDRPREQVADLLFAVMASARQSHVEAAGPGFRMEREALLELAWDSFQALAFRLFPGVLSLCPSQFFWALEMLSSSSGLIFSFRLVFLASRSAIS